MDYAPEWTGRLRVKYKTNTKIHTSGFRYEGEGAPSMDFVSGVQAFLTTLTPLLSSDTTHVATEYAEAGSNIFFPFVPLSVAGTVGGTGVGDTPRFISFAGKSLAGKKVRVVMYGYSLEVVGKTLIADYRIYDSENTHINNALTALSGISDMVAPDGTGSIYWHQYANFGVNAYWQRRLRV
jgi:hypothetical protein